MINIWCGQYAKYGYRLNVGHPVLGKLYDHFRLKTGLGLIACSPKQRFARENVVMAYYAKLYKEKYGHKLDLSSYMQELRLTEIIEQSDIEAAKDAITPLAVKAVEKLKKEEKTA